MRWVGQEGVRIQGVSLVTLEGDRLWQRGLGPEQEGLRSVQRGLGSVQGGYRPWHRA